MEDGLLCAGEKPTDERSGIGEPCAKLISTVDYSCCKYGLFATLVSLKLRSHLPSPTGCSR